jgi:hypothetical protein
MIAWPHLEHGTEASGGRSPGMKTLASHPPHVTIFKGFSLALIMLVMFLNPFAFRRQSRKPQNV